jgi:hypothetical protein
MRENGEVCERGREGERECVIVKERQATRCKHGKLFTRGKRLVLAQLSCSLGEPLCAAVHAAPFFFLLCRLHRRFLIQFAGSNLLAKFVSSRPKKVCGAYLKAESNDTSHH